MTTHDYIVLFTDGTKTVVSAEDGSQAMDVAEAGGKTAMSAARIAKESPGDGGKAE